MKQEMEIDLWSDMETVPYLANVAYAQYYDRLVWVEGLNGAACLSVSRADLNRLFDAARAGWLYQKNIRFQMGGKSPAKTFKHDGVV